jgi:hypothetical protein
MWNWSLTLRDVHRLTMCEYKVLWRIFALEREVITRLETIHNLDLHNLYPSSDTISMSMLRE